jgi:hypothetical protein
MKKLILTMSLALAFNALTQTTTERKKLYDGSFTITQSIKEKDTLTYLSYSYQNQKYKQLTDLGMIFITKQADMKMFAEVLKAMSAKEEGISISVIEKEFEVNIYDFTANVYIVDKRGKYTSLSRKKASQLADELLEQLHLLKEKSWEK